MLQASRSSLGDARCRRLQADPIDHQQCDSDSENYVENIVFENVLKLLLANVPILIRILMQILNELIL